MAKPTVSPRPARKTKGSLIGGLRTGKIHATQASAKQILRTVGVRPADVKVAAKALQNAEPKTTTRKSAKISAHPASGRTSKNR